MSWQTLSQIPGLTVQALVLLVCLLVPGRFLLRRFLGNTWRGQPTYRKVGLSLLVSSLLLTAFESLALVLPAPVMTPLAHLLALVALAGTIPVLRAWGYWRRPLESPHALLVLALAALFGLALYVTWITPIPGSTFAGLGDMPSYYRVVENLSQGERPLVDFRIGDYAGELYFLPTHYPIATLVAGFFKTLFPANFHAYTTVTCLYGLLALFLCAGSLCRRIRTGGTHEQLAWVTAGLLPLLLWQNVEHGSNLLLGVMSLPACALLLVFVDLGLHEPPLPPRQRLPLLSLAALATALSRPEGLLFIGLAAAVLIAWRIVAWGAAGSAPRKALVAGLALASLGIAWTTPWDRVLGKSPSLFYMHYHAATGTFQFHPENRKLAWHHVNHDNARQALGLARQDTRINEAFLDEVRAEPLAFLAWLQRTMDRRLPQLHQLALLVFTLLLLIHGRTLERLLVPLAAAYLVVLTCINPAFAPRHTLPLFTVLLVVSLRAAPGTLRRWLFFPTRRLALSPGVALALAAFLPALFHTLDIRGAERHSPYLEIFNRLEGQIQSGELVASSYPQLAGVYFDTPSVGNSILGETLEAVIDRDRPDWILIDDFRQDLPHSYREVQERAGEEAWQRRYGYRQVIESADALVLRRVEEPGPGS